MLQLENNPIEDQPSPHPLLKVTREEITSVSLMRASIRLEIERFYNIHPEIPEFEVLGSQICDERVPISCSFDETGTVLGIAGWSGISSIYSIPSGSLISSLEGHSDRVQTIDICNNLIATGSFDMNIGIWQGNNPNWLRGHEARVNKVKFHPIGNLILSCSYDKTWKLWDITRSDCIITQNGHGRGIHCLSLHPDGSIVGTGDLSGIGALWDLRTGSHILTLRGHVKQLLCMSISPNGHTISTGSDDNTVKIWDIRKRGLVFTIPAHSKLVSSTIATEKFIGSCSYDGTTKLWSTKDFSLIKTFSNENKVTDINLSPKGDILVTTSFDKTFKLWKLN